MPKRRWEFHFRHVHLGRECVVAIVFWCRKVSDEVIPWSQLCVYPNAHVHTCSQFYSTLWKRSHLVDLLLLTWVAVVSARAFGTCSHQVHVSLQIIFSQRLACLNEYKMLIHSFNVSKFGSTDFMLLLFFFVRRKVCCTKRKWYRYSEKRTKSWRRK